MFVEMCIICHQRDLHCCSSIALFISQNRLIGKGLKKSKFFKKKNLYYTFYIKHRKTYTYVQIKQETTSEIKLN